MGHVADSNRAIGTLGDSSSTCACTLGSTYPNIDDFSTNYKDEVVNYIDCNIARYSVELNKYVGNRSKRIAFEKKIYILSLIKCFFFSSITTTMASDRGCVGCSTYPNGSRQQVEIIKYVKSITKNCNELKI